MFYQEVTIAETPEHRDTRKSRLTSRFQIDITIPHIDSIFLPYFQLTKGSEDGIRSRFLTNPLSLVLAYRHLDRIREEILAEFLSGSHHLIAYHSQSTTSCLEGCKRLRNPIVRTGGVE